ncbi:hypothetical protein [Sphingobacterium mizutaii]|uniref:hypothetical protein n=1 Tax=Sphingobacterium mizutaii TaxID=1010 RepID=UPI0028991924|nr:hypothetical protein [Sphingobacterium mizutaii]
MENENVIKLDEVVNFYLDAWELPDGQYRRISGFGIRALRIIHEHATAAIVMEKIDVERNRTASFPKGCLNLLSVRVGSPSGPALVLDNELGLREEDCDRERDHVVSCNFYDQRRKYRLNSSERTITFHSSFAAKGVYVEYIPLLKNDGEYVVDPSFVEAILAFMGWQDKRRTASDRAKSEDEWWNWLRIGRRAKQPIIIEQIFEDYKRNFNILTS